ncbi:MAG: hypothetical protein GY822_00995 [Deltaproteobacteria bacterium]|nr:hypothetical protein [Deltaproteobacteria bacterium]
MNSDDAIAAVNNYTEALNRTQELLAQQPQQPQYAYAPPQQAMPAVSPELMQQWMQSRLAPQAPLQEAPVAPQAPLPSPQVAAVPNADNVKTPIEKTLEGIQSALVTLAQQQQLLQQQINLLKDGSEVAPKEAAVVVEEPPVIERAPAPIALPPTTEELLKKIEALEERLDAKQEAPVVIDDDEQEEQEAEASEASVQDEEDAFANFDEELPQEEDVSLSLRIACSLETIQSRLERLELKLDASLKNPSSDVVMQRASSSPSCASNDDIEMKTDARLDARVPMHPFQPAMPPPFDLDEGTPTKSKSSEESSERSTSKRSKKKRRK